MYELQVLKSAAGWYIGTTTEDGYPYSRNSVEYYKSKEAALIALDTSAFTWRQHA